VNGWESEVFSVAHGAVGHRKTNTPSSRPLIVADGQVEGQLECPGGQAPVSWDTERISAFSLHHCEAYLEAYPRARYPGLV